MNDDLNEFERVARARLNSELGRVPVPAGRSRRARPRSSRGWGARLVGGSALVAMLALAAMIVAGGLRVAPETAQVATQTAQTAGGAPAERLILLSTTRSSTIIRAVDPATRQVLWMREGQDLTAAASLGGGTPIPAWIDGALSPDGSRLFVATRDGLAAYDAATGQSVWTKGAASTERIVSPAPGRPSALAVAADGQSLYIQKHAGATEYPRRWLDAVDAGTGEPQSSIGGLPSDDGVGQVFALADQIYYVASDKVLSIEPGSRSFRPAPHIDVLLGVSAAAPARDGRSIYVFNGVTMLNFDRSGMISPPPTSQRADVTPTFPTIVQLDVISDTDVIIDYDVLEIERDHEAPFWWKNNPLALSADGKTAAVQEFASPAGPPRLKLYDVASLQAIATIADPGTSKADWLRADTLQFSTTGTAIYAIAGPPGVGGGDSALLSLSVADGGATRLIELPGETVAGLLMASPAIAPDLAGPASQTPTAEPIPAPPELPFPAIERAGPAIELPRLDPEREIRIPPAGRPLVPAGEIGWLLHDGKLGAWDRDTTISQPITDSTIAVFRSSVPRPGKKPLLLVGLTDGRDAVLDPETAAITPLDLPAAAITPPLVLSPDGAQLVFKRSSPGLPDALVQADLATGATWTLIDTNAPRYNWTWLADGALAGWDKDGIYVDVDSISRRSLLRIQPRANADDPAQPRFETLLEIDGGLLNFSPSTGQVAYRRAGETALYLLDTRSGEEQKVDVVSNGGFALSPDGGQLAYIQDDGDKATSLRIYTPRDQRSSVVASLSTDSGHLDPRWSADGRYLIALAGRSPTQIQVFDTRTFVYDPDQPFPLMASYSLPGSVDEVAVQQVTFGNDRLINVITVGSNYGFALNIYNPLNGTRQTFALGDEPAELVFVP